MTPEEQCVINFLKSCPVVLRPPRDAREAVRRHVYEEDQNWANAPLASLLGQRKVEQNDSGQYRITGSGL